MSIHQPVAGQQGYTAGNKVQLIRGGREYFDLLLQLVNGAVHSVHLQTYIFDDDATGTAVADALKQAAGRGVQVYLLADGYASQVMAQHFIDDIKKAGVHFRFFQPLFKGRNFYFGRRLHHKVVVIDNRYALVGGMNITDRYNDRPGHPAWLDYGVFVEGEIAQELCVLCWKTWKNFPAKMGPTPCELNPPVFHFDPEETCMVRMRRNDWVRRKNQISSSYVQMFRHAETQVTILCSYFLPGRVFQKHLFHAAKRGVKIRVILARVSDVPFAKAAERFIYNRLFRNKIEIYEYNGSVLHGKVAACDSRWVTVGSYNVNNLSAYASIELNLDVYGRRFGLSTEQALEQIIRENSVPIKEAEFVRRTHFLKQFYRWLSYQAIKAAIFLFTFYFRHRS